jgi:hypothetical protein
MRLLIAVLLVVATFTTVVACDDCDDEDGPGWCEEASCV